jgi:hypothetical protein
VSGGKVTTTGNGSWTNGTTSPHTALDRCDPRKPRKRIVKLIQPASQRPRTNGPNDLFDAARHSAMPCAPFSAAERCIIRTRLLAADETDAPRPPDNNVGVATGMERQDDHVTEQSPQA